jgi:hypothetical protein
VIRTETPTTELLNDALIQRLVEDAGRIAKHFVGVPHDEWAPALVEILGTAKRGLDFLPPEIAQLVSEQFVAAIAGHALELEATHRRLQ